MNVGEISKQIAERWRNMSKVKKNKKQRVDLRLEWMDVTIQIGEKRRVCEWSESIETGTKSTSSEFNVHSSFKSRIKRSRQDDQRRPIGQKDSETGKEEDQEPRDPKASSVGLHVVPDRGQTKDHEAFSEFERGTDQ